MSKVKVVRETKTCPSLQGKRKARAKPMAKERQRKGKGKAKLKKMIVVRTCLMPTIFRVVLLLVRLGK